jgi:predicted dehydrogenase
MRAIVVGFGSIGSRHARILAQEHDVHVISRRDISDFPRSSTIAEGLIAHRPEYIVIATATDEHFADLAELARLGYSESLLIEKPVFAKFEILPEMRTRRLAVGYNLRFHPLVRRLKTLVEQDVALVSVDFYVGQHIEDWRPGRSYQSSYSARVERGGGVIRDLSHELDLARYLIGDFTLLTATEGRRELLQIDPPHEVVVVGASSQCRQLRISMNCIDRPAQRWIRIRSQSSTYHADLLTGELVGPNFHESLICDRNDTYRLMHQNVLSETGGEFASMADGLSVMKLISEIEQHMRSVRLST